MVWAYASNCPCPFPHIEIKMKRDFQVTCARVLWFADCWLGWVANICSLGLQNCELQIAYATGRRTCRPFQVTCAPVHSILPCIRAGIWFSNSAQKEYFSFQPEFETHFR